VVRRVQTEGDWAGTRLTEKGHVEKKGGGRTEEDRKAGRVLPLEGPKIWWKLHRKKNSTTKKRRIKIEKMTEKKAGPRCAEKKACAGGDFRMKGELGVQRRR